MALVPAEYAVFLALLITFILLVILCFSFLLELSILQCKILIQPK